MKKFIITGPPGSGKSTLSSKLALSFERGFHLHCDDIYNMVKGGYKAPWDDHDSVLRDLMFDASLRIMETYRNAQHVVVVDYVFSIDELQKFVAKIPGEIVLAVLHPDLATNIYRDKHRQWTIGEERVQHYHELFESHRDLLAPFSFDNSAMSVDESVQHVLQKSTLQANQVLARLNYNSNPVIREARPDDAEKIKSLMDQHWGGEPLLVRGENFFPSRLPGFIAETGTSIDGFLFYTENKNEIEIIVFEAFAKHQGLGSRLMDHVKDVARKNGVKRIFLTTHNDNLDALRFYQRRGFHICSIHLNSMEAARKIKPAIVKIGDYGIPIRDEVDLEFVL